MNGSTNVQISAMATFFSVALLWLADYFLPDLMATAPEMLGELFTGALIVAAGILFKHDDGFKSLPGTGVDPNRLNSPPWVAFLAVVMACFMLAGCGTQRPHIDSAADAIVVTAADVETAAQVIHDLCQNLEPGGPCADGAILSTAHKESLKATLQSILDTLRMADVALAAGDGLQSNAYLARTESMLRILKSELARYQ